MLEEDYEKIKQIYLQEDQIFLCMHFFISSITLFEEHEPCNSSLCLSCPPLTLQDC